MADFLIRDTLSGDLLGESAPVNLHQQSIVFLNERISPELAFIRIALGTASIEKTSSTLEWSQLADLSVLGAPISVARTKADLLMVLANKGIDRNALDRHLRQNIGQTGFYNEVVAELIHALVKEAEGQHTLTFLHIYRLLERISYAFPLIYASRTKDFKKGFTTLKDYLGGSSDTKELGFFSHFVEISIDKVLTDANSMIRFEALQLSHRSRAISKVKELIGAKCLSVVERESMEINNKSILDLLVLLRNRFFHFTPNQSLNLSTYDVPDSDAFFKCFNGLFLNWLIVIYFEVLLHQLP